MKPIDAQWEESSLTRLAGGGYAIPDLRAIRIDPDQSRLRQRLTTIHEVLEVHLHGEVRHGRLDQIAIDVIDALTQLDIWREVDDEAN